MDSSKISDDEIDSIDVEKLFCDCCHQLHAKVSEKRQALDAILDDMIKYIENIENVTKTDGEEGNTSQKVMWLILPCTLQLYVHTSDIFSILISCILGNSGHFEPDGHTSNDTWCKHVPNEDRSHR